MPPAPARILWVRLDHIGDVVMSLPALAELRRLYPHARIDALVRPMVAGLVREQQLADRVLSYDTPRFPERGRGAGSLRTLMLIRRLRRRHYALGLEMRGDDVGRILLWLSGVPCRVGQDRIFYEPEGAPNFSFLLTHPLRRASPPLHAVEQNLLVLEVLPTSAATELGWQLRITPQREATVSRKLKSLGTGPGFVALHACSNDPDRNWHSEGFATLAQHLVSEHGVDIVLTGSRGDAAANRTLLRGCRQSKGIFDASGLFSLEELPALYQQARLLVSVDSAPVHLAAAVGTAVVTLMKPELAPLHYPYNQPAGVVLPPAGGTPRDIQVEAVLQVVEPLLRNRGLL